MKVRYEPLFNHLPTRTIVGLLVAAASPSVTDWLLGVHSDGWDSALTIVFVLWLPALLLTDRYRHKYPQRFTSYLFACHFKGAMVMVFIGLVLWMFGLLPSATADAFWLAVLILVVIDFLISLPKRRVPIASEPSTEELHRSVTAASNASVMAVAPETVEIDTTKIMHELRVSVPQQIAAALSEGLPANDRGLDTLLVLEDIDGGKTTDGTSDDIGVLVGTLPLNNVSRLNNYLKYCASRVTMGGYLVVSYCPMESVLAGMKARYPRWLYPFAYLGHFIWYRALPKVPWLDKIYFLPQFAWLDRAVRAISGGRDRALSKAEVRGRLAYYGIEVIHESGGDGLRHIVAQRVAQPVANRKPSYYAVVALEKVGLDGKLIRLHKVRSMYPFSEFLQKKIFQSHGLSNTGKFKNDFRLTDYGPLIRRNWIDEIPGIFDWFRGEVKLVGMRATSPHFLSLYPEAVYQLYIQVKPGLVPPIFDEKTTGFDQIVEIEREYLVRYLKAPIRTDLLYFWYTFRDIFFRKVRSG